MRKLAPILLMLLLISCDEDHQKPQDQIEWELDYEKKLPKAGSRSFFLDEDTLEQDYGCGVFSKWYLINDSSYVREWRNKNFTFILDTHLDGIGGFRAYNWEWNTENTIGFISGCGTYCWSNLIVELDKKGLETRYSYLDIDTVCLNVVEVVGASFKITNIITKDTLVIPNKYFDHRKDGNPLFYTNVISFSNGKLEYSISKEDGTSFQEVIHFDMVCPRDSFDCFYQR